MHYAKNESQLLSNCFLWYKKINYLININDVLWSSFSGLNCTGTLAIERGAMRIETASGEVSTPILASNDGATSELCWFDKRYDK